jgi:uncharacterized RDD family membrane protein YckC
MSTEGIILDENLDGATSGPENYEIATTGQRFANYLVDTIATYIIMFVLGMMGSVFESFDENSLVFNLIFIFSGLLYYTIFEAATGKSAGKYITGTSVVDEHGNKPDFGKAILRSLSRIVPFEALSAFSDSGRMWHDKWTGTYVIKTRK